MESASQLRPASGLMTTELVNGITHGIGFGMSSVALVVLLTMAANRGSARLIVACAIYGATLVTLYLASTLYHAVWSPRLKRVLQIVDHVAIYLLIAGTYTPITLVSLRGGQGWLLFGVIWAMALLGSLVKIFWFGRFPRATLMLYLLMGWGALTVARPLVESLTHGGAAWLAAGGLAYSIGVIFFRWESLRYHHAIWHVFVMLGSTCHFFTVMFYVLPPAG